MANFDFSNLDDDDLDLGIGGDSHVTNPPARHSQQAGQPVSAGNPNAHNSRRNPAAEAIDALRSPETQSREAIKKPDFLQPSQAPRQPQANPPRQQAQQSPPQQRMPAPPAKAPQMPAAPRPPAMPLPPQREEIVQVSNENDYVTSATRPAAPRTLSMPGRSIPTPQVEEPRQPEYVEPFVETEAYSDDSYEAEELSSPEVEESNDYLEPASNDFYSEPQTNPAKDPRTAAAYDFAADLYRDEQELPAPQPTRRARRSAPEDFFDDVEEAPVAPRRHVVEETEETEEEEAPKKSRGRAKKAAPAKKNSKAKQRPPKKQGNYSGGRSKVLFLRIGVFAALGILCLLGVKSIILPSSGPSRTQVMAAAQEALGQTGFPQDAGVGFATAFTKTFLTMDPAALVQRDAELANYAPSDVLQTIDLRYRTDQDTISADGDTPVEGVPGAETASQPAQAVTQGPYFVGASNVDEKNSVITTLAQVNNSRWIYLQVPVTYDPDTLGLAVSATPTFLSPNQVAKVAANAGEPTWQSDGEVVTAFQSDLENYLVAWAASDSNLISRYITTDATIGSKTGLENSVQFSRLAELSVESVSSESLTPNTRRAQADVIWIDPSTNIVYAQSYRLIIEKQPDDRWYVSDITNLGLIPGNPAETDGAPE